VEEQKFNFVYDEFKIMFVWNKNYMFTRDRYFRNRKNKRKKRKNEKEKSKLETDQTCAANAHVIMKVEVAGTHMRS
jgi:hypothetical protein